MTVNFLPSDVHFYDRDHRSAVKQSLASSPIHKEYGLSPNPALSLKLAGFKSMNNSLLSVTFER